MSNAEIMGLIMAGLTILSLIGGAIARDRSFAKSIIDRDDTLSKAIVLGDKENYAAFLKDIGDLHDRINKFSDTFVRRDDLAQHLGTLKDLIEQMRAEQRETSRRIDKVLEQNSKNGAHSLA